MPSLWDQMLLVGGHTKPSGTLKYKPDGTPDFQSDSIAGWTRNRQDGDVNWTGNPYAFDGWFPIWKNSLKGQEAENQQLSNNASKRESDLTNPNSKYYTDYLTKLKGTLSAQSSLNSLLGLNRAMGLSMGGSATIANEQRNALQGKITDAAVQGTQQLWQANTGQANSLLGMQFQNNQAMLNYGLQQKMYEDSKEFDWSGLAGTIGQIGGMLLAPATGGLSMLPSVAMTTANSFNHRAPQGSTQRGGTGRYVNNWNPNTYNPYGG